MGLKIRGIHLKCAWKEVEKNKNGNLTSPLSLPLLCCASPVSAKVTDRVLAIRRTR